MFTISFKEDCHIDSNGMPLYQQRFLRVLSFHNLNGKMIAPVQLKTGEWIFINEKAEKQFDRVYLSAFGFYEGFATVRDETGFFHIDSYGNEMYQIRFTWCGNFQEGKCVVRDYSGMYFHISPIGEACYVSRWKYVGDYKYGIAVAITSQGATHIDVNGEMIHGRYFKELQPFHKGFAVAKDEYGYFHIDKFGNELYSERYEYLEPFYNGVALAKKINGEWIQKMCP